MKYNSIGQLVAQMVRPMRHLSIFFALSFILVACGDNAFSATTLHSCDVFKSLLDHADDAIEAGPLNQRQEQCRQEGGRWAEQVTVSPCVKEVTELKVDGVGQMQSCTNGDGDDFAGMCVHTDADGLFYFNDGPTVPALLLQASSLLGESLDQMRYATLFWPAGVAHDYCYHHNPVTRGLSQQECDDNFLSDLSAVCAQPAGDHPWFDKSGCHTYAAALYAAVHAGGESSFNVMNTRVDYPLWQPLWQQFGLAEPVVDVELKEEIDSLVGHLL